MTHGMALLVPSMHKVRYARTFVSYSLWTSYPFPDVFHHGVSWMTYISFIDAGRHVVMK